MYNFFLSKLYMDGKTLKKICKIVLKKDKKKKGKRKGVKRTFFEDPSKRGAFPIAGRAGFGTYGQPFGYASPAGGTTIIARDQPLEVIKKPPVKLVGELAPEDERKFRDEIIDITEKETEKPKKIVLEPDEFKVTELDEELVAEEPKQMPKDMARDILTRYTPDYVMWSDIWGELTSGGGGRVVEPPTQPTEILQPQLDFSLIRDVSDIPPRLREVAERSRMRKEDINII